MAADRPDPSKPTGHILRFRPRRPAFLRDNLRRARPDRDPESGAPPIEGLGRYERTEEDDYRHRMVMNGVAFVVVAVLIVAGVWIANTMAEMRKIQDCALQGRRNCTPIETPSPGRW